VALVLERGCLGREVIEDVEGREEVEGDKPRDEAAAGEAAAAVPPVVVPRGAHAAHHGWGFLSRSREGARECVTSVECVLASLSLF
jgi:hypothetical protein